MVVFLFVLSFLVNFVAITMALPTVIDTYRRYSRGKLVTCPERNQQATIAVAPKIAAASAVFSPREIRIVKACSLWPDVHCTRACTAQLS